VFGGVATLEFTSLYGAPVTGDEECVVEEINSDTDVGEAVEALEEGWDGQD